MKVFRESGDAMNVGRGVAFWGVLAVDDGAHQRAARLFGAADGQGFRPSGLFRDERQAYEHGVAWAKGTFGDVAFDAAWAEGQAMSLAQAVAYALAEDADA